MEREDAPQGARLISRAAEVLRAIPRGAPEGRRLRDLAASTVGIAAAVKKRPGGAVAVRSFPMSLPSLAQTCHGLRDGSADIGYVAAAVAPRDFPRYMLM